MSTWAKSLSATIHVSSPPTAIPSKLFFFLCCFFCFVLFLTWWRADFFFAEGRRISFFHVRFLLFFSFFSLLLHLYFCHRTSDYVLMVVDRGIPRCAPRPSWTFFFLLLSSQVGMVVVTCIGDVLILNISAGGYIFLFPCYMKTTTKRGKLVLYFTNFFFFHFLPVSHYIFPVWW